MYLCINRLGLIPSPVLLTGAGYACDDDDYDYASFSRVERSGATR